jgi:glycosyltransferase involved in cell wall biosynthesis
VVTIDGRVAFEGGLGSDILPIRTKIIGRGAADPVEIRIQSDTFVPRVDMGIPDDRVLGVVAVRPFVGRRPLRVPSRLTPELLKVPRLHRAFLDTYDVVAANSAYTAEWVQRLWGRASTVVSPPVLQRQPGAKDPVILSVGRFFPNESGHSKKQLELAKAFRRLIEVHGITGWELHLVGGCSDVERGYVDDIRREMDGLPAFLHVNARSEQLDSLYARAQVFWHAGGIGENAEVHPDRFEHFGISVVEAMSAGAVPIVYQHGGPAAIVEPGVNGLHFSSVHELALVTARLLHEPERIAPYALAAQRRAQDFGSDQFADHVRSLVRDGVDALGS